MLGPSIRCLMGNYTAQGLPLPFVKKSLQQVRTQLQSGKGAKGLLAAGHATVFLPGGRTWVLLPKPAASSGLGSSQGHEVPKACRCTPGSQGWHLCSISSVIIEFSAACRSRRGQTACRSSTSCGQTISALLLPREVPSGNNARLLAFALASSRG